jgi:protein-tyrosine kinase
MGLIEDAMERRSGLKISGRRTPVGSHLPVNPDVDLETVRRVVPEAGSERKNRLISESLDKSALRAYKMLRTQVSQRLTAHKWSSIGVTAAKAGEGKSLTAINLALTLAMNPDQHVFLVDFDLVRHSVSTYMGLSESGGLQSALQGTPLSDALVRYKDERLYALLNNETMENSSEFLASEEVTRLIENLRRLGGVVIYDLPPVLAADDYLVISKHIDCTLFVVAEGQSTRGEILQARAMLDETKLLGVVLNKSKDTAQDGYYYG